MTLAWREHPEARAELIAAVLELDEVHAGLGDRLLDATERALTDIVESPGAWPPLLDRCGRSRLRSRAISPFRLRVIYTVGPEGVLVIAYAHESRRPGYWRPRVAQG